MADMQWHWVLPLALAGTVALFLIFRFPGQRWLRPAAVTVAGAMVSVLFGDASALFPILLCGIILTVCAAASARK